jgi:hypothetical protein
MNPTQSTSEHGQNNDFETQLVEYVVTHRPKGDRLEIPDKSFWIDAATEMAKQGIPTTADPCESKWAEINHSIMKFVQIPDLLSLKSIKNHPQAKPLGRPHYETV